MKQHILSDVQIICEPPSWFYDYNDLERTARYYERWVKEFHDFIRDHRSQDPVNLNVERIFKDVCSFCGSEWEWGTEEPGCCQKAADEWQENHKEVPCSKRA